MVEAHEADVVVLARRLLHTIGDAQELGPLFFGGAYGPSAGKQAFHLPSNLQQEQLLARIDLGNQDTLARQNHDQAFAGEPLQGLADRCAADAKLLSQSALGQDRAGFQLQGDNQFLDLLIGQIGEAGGPGSGVAAGRVDGFSLNGHLKITRAGSWQRKQAQMCFRFFTIVANFSYSASLTV